MKHYHSFTLRLRSSLWLAAACLMLGAAPSHGQSGEIPLRPSDKFNLKIGGIPDGEMAQVSGTYTVSDDGTVSLLHLGNVRVAGVKPSELQRRIAQAYIEAEIYTHPNVLVNVGVDQVTTQQVTVISGVMTPGGVPYTTGMTLLDAIGMRGGPDKFADMRKVNLTRTDVNGRATTTVHNLRDYKKHPEEDVVLMPGDKISVETR